MNRQDYWIKQTAGHARYDELLWARPENKLHAGKLLVIGGNLHGFAAPAEAYNEAARAGAGTLRVVLPDAIHKLISPILPEAEFAPSTPSGSFAQKALLEWLECSHWADHVLLAGDLARNSETAILMEKFLTKSQAPLTITKDAANYAIALPQIILTRPDTTLVITMAQLQKLFMAAEWPQAITFNMDLLRLIDYMHEFTQRYALKLIVKQHATILVAEGGQVSTTPLAEDIEIWRVQTAAHAAVWQMQNPQVTFQALTTAITQIKL